MAKVSDGDTVTPSNTADTGGKFIATVGDEFKGLHLGGVNKGPEHFVLNPCPNCGRSMWNHDPLECRDRNRH